MKIVREFSRFAHQYGYYNSVQIKVAKKLVSLIDVNSYKKVLDLGAGDGTLYKKLLEADILISQFIALDFSSEMLRLHPNGKNIKKKCADFNNLEIFKAYKNNEFDMILSGSALQWSKNLSSIFQHIAPLAPVHYFSFFTSNTFYTLHKTANIQSPIYDKEDILNSLEEYFVCDIHIEEFRLAFNSVYEMLQYIKRSGVSGGRGQLSYKEIKLLMKNYPLDYLEFEVIIVKAKPIVLNVK